MIMGNVIQAGNASGVNDGAGAVLVVSKGKMEELNPSWAFKIVASHSAALDPAYMGLGPINASSGVITFVPSPTGIIFPKTTAFRAPVTDGRFPENPLIVQ